MVLRGATRAVDGVSLTLQPGLWTGIVGANGSGKTSLLRALAGRLDVHGGAILANGADRTRDRAWRAGSMGFAPDISALPQSLNGAETFAIVSPAWDADSRGGKPGELRAALDFDRFATQRIGTLSAGMKQRLAIFLAFLNRPSAVVLDEPFTWLDPVCAWDTKQALSRLVEEEGLTLVTALHEMATLTGSCHSGILMNEGRVGRVLDAANLEAGRRDYAAFEAEIIRKLREGSGT